MYREFAAARERARDDYRRDVTLAWNIVRVYIKTKNDKRMPSVQQLLGSEGRTKDRQNVAQLKSALTILSGQYGIPLRKAAPRG